MALVGPGLLAFALTVTTRDSEPNANSSDNLTGFGRVAGVTDHRLNTASSCIGCHIDGMNLINNDLHDWLNEEDGRRLPKGEYGVDKNVYVEPAIRTIEWARNHYRYPVTRSN